MSHIESYNSINILFFDYTIYEVIIFLSILTYYQLDIMHTFEYFFQYIRLKTTMKIPMLIELQFFNENKCLWLLLFLINVIFQISVNRNQLFIT